LVELGVSNNFKINWNVFRTLLEPLAISKTILQAFDTSKKILETSGFYKNFGRIRTLVEPLANF